MTEDRHEFEAMLHKLDIPQPQGETAVTVGEALEIAGRIGYPVLVRPSYVLGGRAMEIVHNDEDLKKYMATAVKEISHDAPILVDKYVVGLVRPSYVLGGRAMEIVHNDEDLKKYMATAVKEISHDAPILVDKYVVGKELEIDAVADGEYVYIPGVMEHIERAGVHSGDSISVYPAQTVTRAHEHRIPDPSRNFQGFSHRDSCFTLRLRNVQFVQHGLELMTVLRTHRTGWRAFR